MLPMLSGSARRPFLLGLSLGRQCMSHPGAQLLRLPHYSAPMLAIWEISRLMDLMDRSRVTLNTAYTHLRRLREKTGCHRMIELMRKLNEACVSSASHGWRP